ncbi:MAG TPA: DUF4230 domain-containing protein [Gaiellaceae bacterium]|nr:DUF4230 domain-containing protein [Gaiellaceae bacterium]
MGVVSPERGTESPPSPEHQPPLPPQEPPPRRGVPWGLIALGLVIVSLVAGFNWVRDLLPSFDNPFSSETIDRSSTPVLQSIQDLGELRAAAGNYQVIVDVEKDTGLPSELLGERTLFVAKGSVDAGVDLRAIGADDVQLSADRRAATVTLPHAVLYPAELDLAESYVYDRDRGLFNAIGDVFSGGGGSERELYLVAERKLIEAAGGTSGLRSRAEANTRTMITSLLRSLGFTSVTIRFE